MVGTIPVTFIPKKFGGRKLGDLEFLSIKEDEDKRVDVDDATSVTNTVTETDLATQTASGGKDMYLGGAKWTCSISSNANFDILIQLYVNGVVVEQKTFDEVSNNNDLEYVFLTKGEKVTTGQIIKITMIHSSATPTRITKNKTKLILWEEPTGESPQIPSI